METTYHSKAFGFDLKVEFDYHKEKSQFSHKHSSINCAGLESVEIESVHILADGHEIDFTEILEETERIDEVEDEILSRIETIISEYEAKNADI